MEENKKLIGQVDIFGCENNDRSLEANSYCKVKWIDVPNFPFIIQNEVLRAKIKYSICFEVIRLKAFPV